MSKINIYSLPWMPLIILPIAIFSLLILFFYVLDVDRNLAFFLSNRPGGFPFANSDTYEFWLHRVPKFISGTLIIGMLILAFLSIPIIRTLEKIKYSGLQKVLKYFIQMEYVVILRRKIHQIPTLYFFSLWLTILAIIFSSEMIGHLKRASSVYCPIEIQVFGGSHNIPLYMVTEPFPSFAPNGGKCWPGGHSITGFIFEACFFGFYMLGMKRAAWSSLGGAIIYGNFLGLIQVIRGQHYLSHQLWSSILCWYFSLVFFWFALKALEIKRNQLILRLERQ